MLAEALRPRRWLSLAGVVCAATVAVTVAGRAPQREETRTDVIETPFVHQRVALAMIVGVEPRCDGATARVQFADLDADNASFTAAVPCAELLRVRRSQLLGVESIYRLELRELYTSDTGLHRPDLTVTRIDLVQPPAPRPRRVHATVVEWNPSRASCSGDTLVIFSDIHADSATLRVRVTCEQVDRMLATPRPPRNQLYTLELERLGDDLWRAGSIARVEPPIGLVNVP